MKRVTLIKAIPEIQAAHVYEHLYCETIRSFFKERGFLYYLDYTYSGLTYNKGLVHIQIDAYTPDTEKLLDRIDSLNPLFNNDAIERTLAQIVAEEKRYLQGTAIDKLLKYLKAVQSQPWATLENLTIIDTSKTKPSHKILWISDKGARIKTLHCDLVLSNNFAQSKRDLLSLFDAVAHIILDNLGRELTAHFGYYCKDNPSKHTNTAAQVSHQLTAWTRFIPHLTNEQNIATTSLKDFLAQDTISKMHAFLSNATYSLPFEAPNEHYLFEASGIVVGATGWRTMGTKTNINSVLRHTTLKLTYGREKHNISLGPLLTRH